LFRNFSIKPWHGKIKLRFFSKNFHFLPLNSRGWNTKIECFQFYFFFFLLKVIAVSGLSSKFSINTGQDNTNVLTTFVTHRLLLCKKNNMCIWQAPYSIILEILQLFARLDCWTNPCTLFECLFCMSDFKQFMICKY